MAFVERPTWTRPSSCSPRACSSGSSVTSPARASIASGSSPWGGTCRAGLLLWGPPGTGKTLTVRYLTGRLSDATVIILSGGSLGAVGAFGAMARRLAPSLVILEDVNLVAEERTYDGGSEVLFELMNQMSGVDEDADVAFVLTTNRPEALEPALAARPGRVDLAVEIPLPDAASRARLIEIYGRGLDLRLADPGAVVERTEGVTASFIKELLRKAAIAALFAGREHVDDADVSGALDELMSETSALTRVMLGAGGDDAPAPASGWLGRFSEDDHGGSGWGEAGSASRSRSPTRLPACATTSPRSAAR